MGLRVTVDLARFDHRHTSDQGGLYRYFYDIVQLLIQLAFKWFRCDAAYRLPGRLWQRRIDETKSSFRVYCFRERQ